MHLTLTLSVLGDDMKKVLGASFFVYIQYDEIVCLHFVKYDEIVCLLFKSQQNLFEKKSNQ